MWIPHVHGLCKRFTYSEFLSCINFTTVFLWELFRNTVSPFTKKVVVKQSVSKNDCSDEGLTLETSAFLVFNSFVNTKLPAILSHLTNTTVSL